MATPVTTMVMLVVLLLLSSTVSEAGRQLPSLELKWEPPIVYPAPIWQPPIIYPGIPPHMETNDLPSIDEQAPTELQEEDPTAPVKAVGRMV
nr:unnamed protein product [Digitaria exilis]